MQIGLIVPRFAIEVCRQRPSPAHLNHAVVTAEPYSPQKAVSTGFLDHFVPAESIAKQTFFRHYLSTGSKTGLRVASEPRAPGVIDVCIHRAGLDAASRVGGARDSEPSNSSNPPRADDAVVLS